MATFVGPADDGVITIYIRGLEFKTPEDMFKYLNEHVPLDERLGFLEEFAAAAKAMEDKRRSDILELADCLRALGPDFCPGYDIEESFEDVFEEAQVIRSERDGSKRDGKPAVDETTGNKTDAETPFKQNKSSQKPETKKPKGDNKDAASDAVSDAAPDAAPDTAADADTASIDLFDE